MTNRNMKHKPPLSQGGSLLIVVVAMTAPSCSGESSAPSTVPDGGTEEQESAPPGPECSAPGYYESTELRQLDQLTATITDLEGEAIGDLMAQACGLNLCVIGTTLADGSVALSPRERFEKPALKYGLGERYVKFAYLLPEGSVQELERQTTARLPEIGSGDHLEPGKTASSGGVTLEIAPDAAEIEVVALDFPTEDLQRFRAVEIPMEKAPAAVDRDLELELLFGMTPIGTEICPPARMTVQNSGNWAPGTRVEFFLHGIEVAEDFAPYGGWARVSNGRVADDGETISTDDGEGIPILSVVGIRRAE